MRELSFDEVEFVSGVSHGWYARAAEEAFGFAFGIGRGFLGGFTMLFQWSDVGVGSDIVPPWQPDISNIPEPIYFDYNINNNNYQNYV